LAANFPQCTAAFSRDDVVTCSPRPKEEADEAS
jgi:hypothetical protein